MAIDYFVVTNDQHQTTNIAHQMEQRELEDNDIVCCDTVAAANSVKVWFRTTRTKPLMADIFTSITTPTHTPAFAPQPSHERMSARSNTDPDFKEVTGFSVGMTLGATIPAPFYRDPDVAPIGQEIIPVVDQSADKTPNAKNGLRSLEKSNAGKNQKR